MADISQIKLPNDATTYNIKDKSVPSWAKQANPPAQIFSYNSFPTSSEIHVGNVAPASVSTTGWAAGSLYVYVKP